MTDDIRDIRAQIVRAGNRRRLARMKARAASYEIQELAPTALEAGLSKSEIARLAGITRPALDTMLRKS